MTIQMLGPVYLVLMFIWIVYMVYCLSNTGRYFIIGLYRILHLKFVFEAIFWPVLVAKMVIQFALRPFVRIANHVIEVGRDNTKNSY